MDEYILTTHAITKDYGRSKVLCGVNMQIPKGAIYGFVGRNGAGKTTLIRVVTGLQAPDSGTYALFGVKNTSKEIYKERRRTGAVVENPAIADELTAVQNLEDQAKVLGLSPGKWIAELLDEVGLPNTGKKKAKKFSLGMKQRLGIAMALCGNPDFLILDEPVNGLDPEGIIEVRELMIRLNQDRGVTILVSSHILQELSQVATVFGFIENGRILQQISAQDLEAACRKSLAVKVSDTKALARTLDGIGKEYRILSDTEAEVYGDITVTALVSALAENGCEVLTMTENEQSLEAYYLNLIGGGGKHA